MDTAKKVTGHTWMWNTDQCKRADDEIARLRAALTTAERERDNWRHDARIRAANTEHAQRERDALRTLVGQLASALREIAEGDPDDIETFNVRKQVRTALAAAEQAFETAADREHYNPTTGKVRP